MACPIVRNVILDTDICTDIDDAWALCMLLKCPELNLKMVSTTTGDPKKRAQIVAKILDRNGRTDVPIAVGLYSVVNPVSEKELGWVADYPLEKYPGKVFHNGVDALIDMLEKTEDPMLICIGPLMNIMQLCLRRPDLCAKTDFVAMSGIIHRGYPGYDTTVAEWNVRTQIAEAQAVYKAKWKSMTITPLDTCALVRLKGERYERLKKTDSPLVKTILENYRHWRGKPDSTDETESSILFDTVAIYLAYTQENLKMQTFKIEIDNGGHMLLDRPDGNPVNAAIDWMDLGAYEEYLVNRLLS